ncbi:MAG: M23 family metallopeptidase [Paludibacter sp.]|jgi:murein DD-endopeptidase MepM/ murein hydrolase activator NlpD|nr:M23 family metallopeptidase [Paludibacter sp.]
MAKKKFHFNPETLSYEEIEYTLLHKVKRLLIHLFSGVSLGAGFFFLFVTFVASPEEKQLSQERNRIHAQYKLLERSMDEMYEVLKDLQQRDDNLYRVIFQSDPIPYSLRTSGSGNSAYYKQLLAMTNSEIAVETTRKFDALRKQFYIQSQSYDDLVKMAKNQEKMLQSIPAIMPVLNKDLKKTASGYGWRIDPIYRTRRFHEGMDFTAPTGTDIFATGQGKVIYASWRQGYGNTVMIDHGFNYKTLYAHMHMIQVRVGQQVNRGEVIGTVGNTGKSTGPHLHYEVHHRGVHTNPQHYYFLDLSPKEYDEMVQISNNAGQMFD